MKQSDILFKSTPDQLTFQPCYQDVFRHVQMTVINHGKNILFVKFLLHFLTVLEF